jgi:hypothetical protein
MSEVKPQPQTNKNQQILGYASETASQDELAQNRNAQKEGSLVPIPGQPSDRTYTLVDIKNKDPSS